MIHSVLRYCVTEAAIEVHKELGAGHSETVYETALAVELLLQGVRQRTQVPCVLNYKGCDIGVGYIDLLVEEQLIVEIKTVAKLTAKDEAQVRKYLVAAKQDKGLLINFGSDLEIIEVEKISTKLANGIIVADFEVNPVELKQSWEKGNHGETSSEAN